MNLIRSVFNKFDRAIGPSLFILSCFLPYYSHALRLWTKTASSKKLLLNMSSLAGPDLQVLKTEALSKFVRHFDKFSFQSATGGVNNICDYATNGDEKYLLRIYNNGFNSERVSFEHMVMNALKNSNQKLAFKVPAPVPALADGSTYALLSNGAEACLFEFIPGELPKTTRITAVGRACGQLVSALGTITITRKSPNPRYNQFFKAHHATTRDLFYSEVKKPAFDVDANVRKYTDLLVEEILYIEKCIEHFNTLGLPEQLIHADLHYDNVLVDGDKVSGLLDFEFSGHDWRAAELAVCLSKYASFTDSALDFFSQFMDGFIEYGRLSEKEIEIMPELINLRILNNVVYFVGRAVAGEDGIEALTTRVEMYYTRVKWIKENRKKIVDMIKEKMRAANAIVP